MQGLSRLVAEPAQRATLATSSQLSTLGAGDGFATVPQVTTALSPELIASMWSPSDPQISPDGRYVAWTAAPLGKEGEHAETGIWVCPG
jgi:hypothetical protein